jgi:two-component system NtrC family sensor kinase
MPSQGEGVESEPQVGKRGYGVRRRLGLGLGGLGAIVFASAAVLLGLAAHYHATLDALDGDASLARRARALGVYARDQYIHEAHTIIVGDRSHVGHQQEGVDTFAARARELARELPIPERARLDRIASQSVELQRIFAREILPAVDRGDREGVRTSHERAESLVSSMIRAADYLGDRVEARARETARRADATAHFAMALGSALALAAGALAAVVARRVWAGVGAPLASLQSVAERVAGGDTGARVGALPAVELAAVGRAFDQMLDRLARREASLVHAERLAVVGRLVAGVAHEINNPIGVIRGYLKTMLAEVAEPGLRAELAILDEESLACQRIVEDLLTYARVPALAPQPTNADALAAEVVARLGAAGELGTCEVRSDVEAATLEVDPFRMRQVLANLLRNGAQAMGGAGVLDVAGRALPGGGYEFVVSDRGPGIAPEVRPNLFEPFATTRPGGTGLGLAVCEGIVQAHGGGIAARDRHGGGAEFVIRLPDTSGPEADA